MLELIGLQRRFGSVRALDDLSFSVAPGQVFGFLGPNGAGKTTAMRAVFGLTALDAGEVRWRGQAIDERGRRSFGYMPEERGLYPNMPVLDQLVYLAGLHDVPAPAARAQAISWLERFGLAPRARDRLQSLSLGNQQRVQLAAALVHDPPLLVLDEPFSGLDPGAVDAMSEVLAQRAADGATVLFSSHQLDLVEGLCDAVAIVDRGRVMVEGRVRDLARSGPPQLEVAVREDPAGRWAQRDLPGRVRERREGRLLIELHGDPADSSQTVLDRARAAGTVEHFGFVQRRLSEVFRDAVASSGDGA